MAKPTTYRSSRCRGTSFDRSTPSPPPEEPLEPLQLEGAQTELRRARTELLNNFPSESQSARHEYNYDARPLDVCKNQIRIIRLYHAVTFNAPLTCNLRVSSLNENPNYAALSYCWGDPVFDHEILCDGKVFLITKGLFSALRVLRSVRTFSDQSFWQALWVDQICIDQRSNEERSSQVRLMSRIYSQAENVFIWLGDPIQNTEAAYELARECYVLRDAARASGIEPTPSLVLSRTDRGREQSIGLADILSRPWFVRRWVIQEATLAKKRTFFCGPYFFPWECLEAAVNMMGENSYITYHEYTGPTGSQRILSSTGREVFTLFGGARSRIQANAPRALEDLLGLGTRFRASDERDMIYSLLGLVHNPEAYPAVDYTLPFSQVYYDFARALITEGRTLNVLSYAGHRNFPSDMPSWVPDFRNPVYPSFFLWDSDVYDNAKVFARFGADPATLILRGIMIDTISEVSLQSPTTGPERLEQGLAIIASRLPAVSSLHSKTKAHEILSKLLVLEGLGEWSISDSESRYLDQTLQQLRGQIERPQLYWQRYTAYTASGAPSSFPANFATKNVAAEEHAEYFEEVSGNLCDRRIFGTEGGLVGICPNAAEVGDVICAILGAPYFYALKKDGSAFSLIGDVFTSSQTLGAALVRTSDDIQDIILH